MWKIARALRTVLRSRVALDERLRRAAGTSFGDCGRARTGPGRRCASSSRWNKGDGPVFGPGDTLGTATCAFLDEIARGFEP